MYNKAKVNVKSKEIKLNYDGPRNFDICFRVIFSCYDLSLFSGREKGTSQCVKPTLTFLLIFAKA